MRSLPADRGRVRVSNALSYLVGEKFLNFLEVAESNPEFRVEVPAFAAEVKTIFEPWQLEEYLETARQTEPFDPDLYDEEDDPEFVEMERQDDIRRSARDLLLVEQAREWLLGMRGHHRWMSRRDPRARDKVQSRRRSSRPHDEHP